MGYHVTMSVDVVIPEQNIDACLQAINKLHTDENLSKHTHGGRGWVDNPKDGKFNTLQDAFSAWRYESHAATNGDVDVDNFNGERWGDDDQLFKAIAPFALRHSHIDVIGEDYCHWRYWFNDKKVEQQDGVIEYQNGIQL